MAQTATHSKISGPNYLLSTEFSIIKDGDSKLFLYLIWAIHGLLLKQDSPVLSLSWHTSAFPMQLHSKSD